MNPTNDIKSQYEKELIYQEINSNKRTLKGIVWFLLAMGFVWLLTFIRFFDVSLQMVSITLCITALLFLTPLIMLFKGTYDKPWVKYFLLFIICVAAGSIFTFLSFHATLIFVIPLLFAIQYRKRRIIWYAYGVNIVTMLISSLLSFYHGLCDLNLLFESRYIRNWYLDAMANGPFNLPLNSNPVFIIIVFEVFPRSIILLVFSIMMQYTVVSSADDAVRIARLTYLKETDTKTKVFNKNKYIEMTSEYYPKIARIAVLFWDMNDLKKINDTYGHAMGDYAIDTLSHVLHSFATERCRIYRIGGDEFVMIIDNPLENEAENMIGKIKELLSNANKDKSVLVQSAVGVAYGAGKDILTVVENADNHMYEDKKICKEKNVSC